MRHICRCNLLLRLYICLFCNHVCADGYLRLTSSMCAFIYLHARSYFPASSSTYRHTYMYGHFEDTQQDRCVLRACECRQLTCRSSTNTLENPSTPYETEITSVDCKSPLTGWKQTDERDDRSWKNSRDVRERMEEREEWRWEEIEREQVGSLFVPASLTEARAPWLKEIGRSAAKKGKSWKKDRPWGEKKTTRSWRSTRVSA